MLSSKRRQTLAWLLAASFSAFCHQSTLAQSVQIQRTIESDWSWFDGNGNRLTGSFNDQSSALGDYTRDINVVGSRTTTVESQAIVESDGKIRTFSGILSDSPQAGDASFGSLNVRYQSLLTINDIISVDDPNASYVVMLPQLTGSISQDAYLTGGDTIYIGSMTTDNIMSIYETNSTGSDIFEFETDFRENEINPSPISRNLPINSTALFYFDLTDGSSNLNLFYEDVLDISIEGVDAEGFYMFVQNDFFSTFELFANVYDANGTLLEGVTVTSALGHTYQNFTPVPEPSGMALLLATGCVIGWRKPRDRRIKKTT